MKSWNDELCVFRIALNDLAPGILRCPLPFFVMIGYSVSSSKNICLLVAISSTSSGGTPTTSYIIDNYSYSLSPGKIGNPVYNSIRMQPKLHMSMAVVYGIPRIISGAR